MHVNGALISGPLCFSSGPQAVNALLISLSNACDVRALPSPPCLTEGLADVATKTSHAVLDRSRSGGRERSERPGPLTIRLADRHRWVGFLAALTAAGGFAFLWVPNLGNRVATGATGTSYLLIGLALSGLLVAASVTRRGVLMAGGALLVAVGPWGPEFALQIIFFVYAVFLMVMVARQTRDTSRGDNRISSWLSGLRVRLAPSPAPAAGTARPRPASSARYTAPQRRRR